MGSQTLEHWGDVILGKCKQVRLKGEGLIGGTRGVTSLLVQVGGGVGARGKGDLSLGIVIKFLMISSNNKEKKKKDIHGPKGLKNRPMIMDKKKDLLRQPQKKKRHPNQFWEKKDIINVKRGRKLQQTGRGKKP